MSDVEAKLQGLSAQYQKLEEDFTNAVDARSKLDSQLQENIAVQKEFSSLDDDANIYKMIGPVLVKQDKPEATMNVEKRLEFINGEIKRVEAQIQDLGKKREQKKMEIIQLQQSAQQAQASA